MNLMEEKIFVNNEWDELAATHNFKLTQFLITERFWSDRSVYPEE